MKLYATGFLLIVIWTDMGITKNGGDFDTMKECREAWTEIVACWKDELKNPERTKYKDWGQPVGFCLQGERMNAPGIIYPTKPDSGACG